MALLDDLMAQGGSVCDIIKKNPQLVAAAVSMLSTKQGSVGGTGGLDGLVGAFQRGGMGDVMSSWVGTGANQQISPGQLADVLGPDMLSQFGKAAGVSGNDATSALSSLLPALVNGLTPRGQVPQGDSLEGMLGGLLKGLGR
jgi:uncharacterized protein YidB (DUF937 family)